MFQYPYELPELPYGYDALEPFIDEETMHYHHDKHFQTYIDNLNQALAEYPTLQSAPLTWLLTHPDRLPERDRKKIWNNAGGVFNHFLFFNGLTPEKERTKPTGVLLRLIERQYGSFEAFQKAFSEQAAAVFGSGWTFLTITPAKKLEIVNVANQDNVLILGLQPLILFDVWEHAYYLKYRNRRKEYIENIWNVVSWPTF